MNILNEFDISRFKLGSLCKRGHEYKNTGHSLRRIKGSCVECEQESYQKTRTNILRECCVCLTKTQRGGVRPLVGDIGKSCYYCESCIKTISHKQCSQCQIVKPIDSFHAGNIKNYIDGRRGYCKECHKSKYKDYCSPSKIERKAKYKKERDRKIAELTAATEKKCSKCQEVKPKEEFKPRKEALDGLNQQCRDCVNARREQLRRSKGIKPKKPEYAKLEILESFIGKIDGADELSLSGIYYLGGVCIKGHDWENTGYSLRFKSSNHCLACNYDDAQKNQEKYKETERYKRWLKNPRISPTVAELVAKSEQWARVNRKALFMTPEEKERYNLANREKSKKNYYKNLEKERTRVKIYKHANPEKVAKWGDRRRQKVAKQSDGSVTALYIKKILDNAKKCPYCSTNLTPSTATIDHLVPIALGGSHAKYNIVPCCYDCNVKKSAKPFVKWLDELDEKHKKLARSLYTRLHGAPPEQQTLPLMF